MKREDVFRLIEGEQAYQKEDWKLGDIKEVGSYLSLMSNYLREAQEGQAYYGDKKALESIRKVAALAVRCMELHETAARGK